MKNNEQTLLQFTDSVINQVKYLIKIKNNPNLKLRIYIVGGGCSGFKYEFILDEKINKDDIFFEKNGIYLVTDSMSLQYLINSSIDYKEDLSGSKFVVINPNVKNTCSCGISFNI